MEPFPLYWLLSVFLIVVGLAGVVIPAIPGPPLLFLGLFVAAWCDDFAYAGWGTLAVLAALAVLIYGVDLWAAMFGAKRFGASKQAIIGALIGLVAGLLLGFPGVIFGPFIGAVTGELLARRGLRQAARAGVGATIGLVVGAALKLALALAMVGIFAVARFL